MPRPTDAIPRNEVKNMILIALKSYGIEVGDIDMSNKAVEQSTRERLAGIEKADPALVANAIALAQLMDSRPSASVAKEHRETMLAITKASGVEEKSEKTALKDLLAGVQTN